MFFEGGGWGGSETKIQLFYLLSPAIERRRAIS